MPGGGSSGDMTQQTIPWSGVQPYLLGNPRKDIEGIFPAAHRIYEGGPPSYFPGDPVAGFTPPQLQAQQATIDRATAGSPLNRAAGAETMRTLEGGYLGEGNPYLEGIRSLGEREASRIAGNLSGGGQHSMQSAIAEGYGNAVNPYLFQSYESERARMADAARFAPQLATTDYQDIAALGAVGAEQQAQEQAEINAAMQRHQYEQNIPSQWLDWYSNLLRGQSSGFSTQIATTPQASPLQTGLGGALTGAASGAMIGSVIPGIGTAIGAIGGGLLGGAGGILSDEDAKERIRPADTASVAERLAELPIAEWNYRGDPNGTRHLGPMAAEFKKRFGIGDGVTLHPADVMGVILAAAKEMAAKGKAPKRRLLKGKKA